MIYLKKTAGILLAVLLFTGNISQLKAQDFTTISLTDLKAGSVIKGIYLLESGNNTGLFIKEQVNGTLSGETLDAADERFYFWVTENTNDKSFQLHSASTPGSVVMINEDGLAKLSTDHSHPASKLMLKMEKEGPLRDSSETSVIAIGSIITQELEDYSGAADCRCHGLTIENETRIIFHKRDFSQEGYRDIHFSKTNNSSNGSVNKTANSTRLALASGAGSQNFVSSLFYVNGFGINDFQLTASSGTEAVLGLLDYTQHQFKAEVYNKARPKIGLKIANEKISLIYLSGDQELPLTSNVLDGEIETDFEMASPIYFGFEDQNTFAAVQNGDTVRMQSYMPAELFLNRSVSQTARMLVNLDAGQIDLAYKTANGILNSGNDQGISDGKGWVSTDPFLPYNNGKSFVNGFDWYQSKWKVRFKEGVGEIENEVFSPFYSRDAEMSSISAQFNESGSNLMGGEDFSSSEGWELVKANLGFNASGSVRNEAPQYPYILFYDRVSATLRTFVYAKNEGEANQLNLTLGVVGGKPGDTKNTDYTPLLWGSLQQFSTLDETRAGHYTKSIKFYGSEGRKWYFFDHVMEYDPCSEFFESSIEITISKTVKGELSLVGRVEGGTLPAGTEGYADWAENREEFLMGVMDTDYGTLENTLGDISFNQYDKYDLMEFQTQITGELIGMDIPEWEKEAARLEWETQALDAQREQDAISAAAEEQLEDGIWGFVESGFDAVSAVPGVGSVVGGIGNATLKRVRSTIDIVEGASTLLEERETTPSQLLASSKKLHYENLRDTEKYDDQVINLPIPPPRPHVLFGELALKGTLSIEIGLDNSYYIATPGALNSGKAPQWRLNGTRGAAPLYNRPLGKFSMLTQPEFGVAVSYDSNRGIYKAYLKTNQKPYFAINSKIQGKVADAFKIAINVRTIALDGKSKNRASAGYHNQFSEEDTKYLPGEMDISELIDWNVIKMNISTLPDQSPAAIASAMEQWISISYDVWALTITNLKARNLTYVMASSNQYFTGTTSFELKEESGFITGFSLANKAKELANSSFSDYTYGDHDIFGSSYQISNIQNDFAAIMYDYCTSANGGFAPDTAALVEVTSIPKNEQDIPGAALKVYPNPTRGLANFEFSSEASGETMIILYDYLGHLMIQTTAYSNGYDTVSGKINMSVLPSGVYILQMILPNGEVLSEQIIRE